MRNANRRNIKNKKTHISLNTDFFSNNYNKFNFDDDIYYKNTSLNPELFYNQNFYDDPNLERYPNDYTTTPVNEINDYYFISYPKPNLSRKNKERYWSYNKNYKFDKRNKTLNKKISDSTPFYDEYNFGNFLAEDKIYESYNNAFDNGYQNNYNNGTEENNKTNQYNNYLNNVPSYSNSEIYNGQYSTLNVNMNKELERNLESEFDDCPVHKYYNQKTFEKKKNSNKPITYEQIKDEIKEEIKDDIKDEIKEKDEKSNEDKNIKDYDDASNLNFKPNVNCSLIINGGYYNDEFNKENVPANKNYNFEKPLNGKMLNLEPIDYRNKSRLDEFLDKYEQELIQDIMKLTKNQEILKNDIKNVAKKYNTTTIKRENKNKSNNNNVKVLSVSKLSKNENNNKNIVDTSISKRKYSYKSTTTSKKDIKSNLSTIFSYNKKTLVINHRNKDKKIPNSNNASKKPSNNEFINKRKKSGNILSKATKKECEICKKMIDSHLFSIHYNSHPTPIFSWLYLGTFANACDIKELKANGINYILNCAIECKNKNLPENIKELHLNVKDYEDFDIFGLFEKSNEFINNCRNSGGNILVHCKYGISRSAAFIIAYLIKHLKLTLEEALDLVKTKRPKIKPNEGFIDQLWVYEKFLKGEKN